MKLKHFLIILILLMVIIIGCSTSQKTSKEISQKTTKESANENKSNAKEDFGCFYSCTYFPEGYPKQMCEDWKAGKPVYWPSDCNAMQYDPCIKFCESEKKKSNQSGAPVKPNYQEFPQMPQGNLSQKSENGFPEIPQSPADFIFHTRKPFCAEDNDYRAQLVYARPSDAADRYESISKKQKQWVANANGIVNSEAMKFGMTADIKIACKDNELTVLSVVLPKKSSQYNTHDGKTTLAIATSLKELGYDDTNIKYMVYYDSTADGCEGGKATCSGQFTPKGPDDKLAEDNMYNIGPDYSVMYDGGVNEIPERYHTDIDMMAPIIMLHEYSHTLGAVQPSAPHSSKDDKDVGHCNDEPPMEKQGNDIMCRSDNPATVYEDKCKGSMTEMIYDCNNDDYFNPKPEAGSYLATHWNLGSELNHFFKFGEKN